MSYFLFINIFGCYYSFIRPHPRRHSKVDAPSNSASREDARFRPLRCHDGMMRGVYRLHMSRMGMIRRRPNGNARALWRTPVMLGKVILGLLSRTSIIDSASPG